MLSPTALRTTRLVLGLAALGAGTALLATGTGNAPVMVALVAWGVFCLLSLALDVWWARLLRGAPASNAAPAEGAVRPDVAEKATEALRTAAGTVIQTSGVVLGLVAALADNPTPALRAGSRCAGR